MGAIKVADLIHCSRPLELHHRWVDLITEEFFNQGDLEKAKNMQLSPGMDRSQPPGAPQQVGFTEIFVLPLFKAWREYAIKFGSQEGTPLGDPIEIGALDRVLSLRRKNTNN